MLSPVTQDRLVSDLAQLGVRPGADVLVHASLRRVGFVVGGAWTLAEALVDAVGTAGSVLVPAFTAGNSDPSRWGLTRGRPVPAESWGEIRERMPAFDPALTPSERMGVLAETVRTWPGARRSGHPQTSFAAVGAGAAELTSGHDPECHLGERSPLGRVHERERGQVLLLGVGFEVCSAFHLGEYRWAGNDRREYECVVLRDGRRTWWQYTDVRLDDSDFGRIGASAGFAERAGVRRGRVGAAEAVLMPFNAGVDAATEWMTRNRRPRTG